MDYENRMCIDYVDEASYEQAKVMRPRAVSVRLPGILYEDFREKCEQAGVPMSSILYKAVIDYLTNG